MCFLFRDSSSASFVLFERLIGSASYLLSYFLLFFWQSKQQYGKFQELFKALDDQEVEHDWEVSQSVSSESADRTFSLVGTYRRRLLCVLALR